MAKDPIKKADNGTYYFRANLGYDSVTGKQIQKYRSGFSTKKEARAEYSKLILAAEEGLAMEKKQPSFKQFIEEIYLPWYKTQVKESTYKNRLNTIEKHFKFFYRKKVNEIEPIHVQTWQLKLAKDYSPNYVRIIQGMLSLAFDRAIILGLAKKNPARMVGNIKSKKVKVDFWTLEEFQKVISLLYKGDYYEHYLFICFWLLFTTGLRIGEAAALQWEDIDFDKREICIQRAKDSGTGQVFHDPKTKAGIRYIPIVYDACIERLKAMQTSGKITYINGFVFCTESGKALNYGNIRRAWVKICELAGVNKNIHTFRHTFATAALTKDIPILEVSRCLGHADANTTLKMYGHAMPGFNRHIIDLFQRKKTKSATKTATTNQQS